MTCNHCGRALRWDEEQRPIFLEGVGQVWCCPDCQARAQGLPAPAPRRYPAGSRIPRHPRRNDGDMPLCGLCRLALPYGQEQGVYLRLRTEFLGDDDPTPGSYVACNECVARWRPRLLDYLKAEGLLPETATERNVAGGMLS